MKQLFIMIAGFSGSGRTTLAKEISDKFPNVFNILDVKDVHSFLNDTYPAFKDDNTISGGSFNIRQEVSDKMEELLMESFLKAKLSIIYDSANLDKKKRKKFLDLAKSANSEAVTVLIMIKIPEDLVLNELKGRDEEAQSRGLKPVWVDLYEKVQKEKYEEPTDDEADKVLFYDRENLDEVLKLITGLSA